MQMLSEGEDCLTLEKRLHQLEATVQQYNGRDNTWDRVVRVVKQGAGWLMYVTKGSGSAVQKIAIHTWETLVPMFFHVIAQVTMFILYSPRTALIVLTYLKHLKRQLCREQVSQGTY